jgi:hypothetical protein
MPTVIDEFITRFGFETDDKELDKTKKKIGDFKASAVRIFGAIGAIVGGGALVNNIANAADESLKFADSIGDAVESVNELEFAVKRQGGTVEGLRGSLESISKVIGEVSRGQGEAKDVLAGYGISIKKANGELKTSTELMVDLNQTFAGLSKAKQFDLAAKMGIDSGTIRLLQTAPEEVSKLTKQARQFGVITRQEAMAAAEFNDGLTNIIQSLKKVGFTLGVFVFKPIAKFFNLIAMGISFFREHAQFVGILIGVLAALNAQFIILKVQAALAWLAALGPIALIIAGIVALTLAIALLIDDIVAFARGQDSLLGDALKRWPILLKIIKAVGNHIKDVINIWKGFIQTAWEFWEPILSRFETFVKLMGKAKSFFGKGETNIATKMKAPLEPAPVMTKNQFATGGTKIGDKITTISIGEMKIDAKNGDSQEIAQNVDKKLKDQLQNTVEDFDSGIKR